MGEFVNISDCEETLILNTVNSNIFEDTSNDLILSTPDTIFIEPIKIVDLAKKMKELSGRDDIDIEFSGLRPGEKLYEELLINDSDMKTEYESITVAGKTEYDIKQLNQDIIELLSCEDKIEKLKKIVPEFDPKLN